MSQVRCFWRENNYNTRKLQFWKYCPEIHHNKILSYVCGEVWRRREILRYTDYEHTTFITDSRSYPIKPYQMSSTQCTLYWNLSYATIPPKELKSITFVWDQCFVSSFGPLSSRFNHLLGCWLSRCYFVHLWYSNRFRTGHSLFSFLRYECKNLTLGSTLFLFLLNVHFY